MGLRGMRGADIPRRTIDLQELALELGDILGDSALTIYIFGSRKDQTGSIRSDVDLLVELPRRVSQVEMSAIWDLEPYLDVFALDRGVATSLINESELRAESSASLIARLGAVCLMRNGNWQPDANDLREQIVLAERNPAATIAPLYDLEDAVPAERADLLVVTALTEEYDAVLSAFNQEAIEPSTLATLIDDKKSPWKVRVLNLNEMGSVGSALKTADAMRRTKPTHVILVGICGGIPERSNYTDVIVPKSVIYYEPSKTTPDGIRNGFATFNLDYSARNQISAIARAFEDITVLAEDQVMACGEKVIADQNTRDALTSVHRKIAAIDMESYGVVRAAEVRNTPVTVIKSVCDLADSDKSDDFHEQARRAAADVLVRVITHGAFRSGR